MHLLNILSLLALVVCVAITIIMNDFQTNVLANSLLRGNETDRLALLTIKSKITWDPRGVLDSWNESSHFCTWEGVTCGRRHKRVTMIDLSSYGLEGSLSPSVGNLSFLRNLYMYNNTLTGSIPPEIGRLSRLERLSLQNNSLRGEIPTNISGCVQLTSLELRFNKLDGKLPFGLSFLSKLEYLGLAVNKLTGDNLSPLMNLTSLKILILSRQANQGFHGRIPDFIGNFKHLKELYLGGNSFSGMIPSSLYNLSNLEILSLADNQLEGVLPRTMGFHFPQLRVLELFNNHLSGKIPFSLSNLSKLEDLDLRYNNFSGKFLFDGSKMQNLSWFDVGAAIVGRGEIDELDFLNTLVNCSNLQFLNVYENNFGGMIPRSIANFSVHLYELVLSDNLISGSIPSGLSNLLSLQRLQLYNNKLTGVIPPDIGKISRLESLDLDSNFLSGKIPLSLGNLSRLSILDLSNNSFHGIIPATLGNCKNLLSLDLSHNKLVGSLTHNLFQASQLVKLYLEANMLQGSLPSEIGDLHNIVYLDISNNNLYGNIPNSLGQCLALTYLRLDGNLFNGVIPLSLSQLQGLQHLGLSNNNLSGQVPKYFSNFTDLTYLNLSYNNFEGDIPSRGVFANASTVFLVGNTKLCGGIPRLKLPRCALMKSKATKNSHVLVFAISIPCFLVGLAIVSTTYLVCMNKKKLASSEISSRVPFIQMSYGMLLKATNGFSIENLIGSGNFSSVYKGIISIDRAEKYVAIKVFSNQHQGASQSFLAECEALRVVRHRNLVRVLTACSSIDYQGNVFNAIVYELMSKGSLESWLYSNQEVDGHFQGLNLLQRLNIAIDVAHALDYIQSVCKTPFVHCDLKPSNILLDDDFVAHVGDFGLMKLPPEIANELPNYISLGVRGTVGYTAPEYGIGASVSAAGDVYSYGITLLEVMTAKKPIDAIFEGEINLRKFAESALPDRVQEILDPRLKVNDHSKDISIDLNDTPTRPITRCAFDCITSMITIGIRCSSELPQDRMDIKDVIRELQSRKDQLLVCGRRHRCQIMN